MARGGTATTRMAKYHMGEFFKHHNIRTAEDCHSCAEQLSRWLSKRGYIIVPRGDRDVEGERLR